MILIVCLAIGLLLRILGGRKLSDLAHTRIQGETALLLLLVLQALLPLLRVVGGAAHAAFYLWLATFPLLASIAWLNRRQPGMAVLGAGLLLNFVVIAVNGGMPVLPTAVTAATGTLAALHSIPVGDFVHLIGSGTTRLPWLADVVPVPGPHWVRSVASPGDCLLFVGVAAYLAGASRDESSKLAPHTQERGSEAESANVE
jgi:hypothetical protein